MRRLLLDTCILNVLFDHGASIFDGEDVVGEGAVVREVLALRTFAQANQRAFFELVISPLTVAEIANTQSITERNRRLSWTLEMLDHWITMLDDFGTRDAVGGNVRHRFKLTKELQAVEDQLRAIPDFRRDPFDRLLLLQYRMASCEAILTTDEHTIWRNRDRLRALGITVLKPSEFIAALGLS